MRKKKELPISTFLKEELSINRKCINLQNKAITLIDQISPFLCSQIQVLNLKNNKLTSLKGISQFGFLKQLDISYNQISNCIELNALKNLVHLKKLHFSNNPFLSEPLQQNLLDIIVQKQTDIDILSLSLMKEVENQEIKIIFLKNYLNKIQLHQELKRKQYVNENKSKLKTQKLVDKIIPQFYSIIENQKLTNSIKREALDIKKKTNDSLEGALSKTKVKKQMKIDELLTNIVEILHQSNNFTAQRNFMLEVNLDNSTISFSPEKQRQFKNSLKIDEDAQFSPVRYIQLSKDQNSLEEINISNSKQMKNNFSIKPKNTFSNTQQTNNSVHKSPYTQIVHKSQQPTSNLDNIETSRKDSSLGKLKSHNNNFLNEFKKYTQQSQNYQTEKTLQEKKITQNTPNKQHDSKNFNSTLKKPTQNQKNQKNQYIKVIDEHAEEMNSERKSPINPAKKLPLSSPTSMQSPLNWKRIIQNNTDLLIPQCVQTIYYKALPKIHPMFQLLYSPSASLTVQQKDTILQALKAHHKSLFIELLEQTIRNQNLMREIDQVNNQSADHIQSIVHQNKEVYQENIRLKQQFEWIDNRNKALQQDFMKLNTKFKELQFSEKNKTTTIVVMENSYKKIKDSYIQKMEELQRLETYEHLQQQIASKRQNRIVSSHIIALREKSELWKKILEMEQKSKSKRERQLYIWGFLSFEANKNLMKDLSKVNKKHNLSIVKEHFVQWIICRNLERKQKLINIKRGKKLNFQLIQFLKINYSSSKMKKLRNVWAKRFYKENKYKKCLIEWCNLVQANRNNWQKATNYHFLSTTNKYLQSIKQLIKQRKNNVTDIQQKHKAYKRKKQFLKMVYFMKKEIIENSQKQKKLRHFYEHCTRVKSFKRIKDNTLYLIQRKSKENQIDEYIRGKHTNFLKKYSCFNNKKMNKLCRYIRYLKWKTAKNQLKIQKKSFDTSNLLLSKNKKRFIFLLKHNMNKEQLMRLSVNKLQDLQYQKLHVLKLKFIKWLEVLRLKGRNYIKHRVIQQMDAQMSINDTCAHQLIKQTQDELLKCQQEIAFLKRQIQFQSNRQIHLLTEKDQMAISINESYQIMMELRKQIQLIREQSKRKDENYNTLARKYNEAFALFQKNRPNP